MLRHLTALLLPAVLLAGLAPTPAHGQWPVPGAGGPPSLGGGLTGTYVNEDTGGTCHVYQMGRGYLFVDDAAQRVPFVAVGGDRLRSVSSPGRPVPDIIVTEGRD